MRKVWSIIGILISILSIVFILFLTDFWEGIKKIKQLDVKFVILAFIMQTIFLLLWALRLKLIARNFGEKINYTLTLKATLIGMFYAAITPSSSGGEPARIKILGERCKSYGISTAIVIVERLLDFLLLLIVAPIILVLANFPIKQLIDVLTILSIIFILAVGFLYLILKDINKLFNIIKRIVIFVYRILRKDYTKIIQKIYEEIQNFKKAIINIRYISTKNLFVLCIITLIMWSVNFLIPSIILLAMHLNPLILITFAAQILLLTFTTVFVTPGGSGLAEFGMAYIYSRFIPKSCVGILVIFWRLITYYFNLIIGALANIIYFKPKK